MIKAVIFDMFETLITHYNSPLYFSEEMAADAGISGEEFRALWRPAESDRTVGKITLEELVEHVLWENGVYSEDVKERIVQKRMAAKKECFAHLHPEILPMLQQLKNSGIKIGLISNCFSEEVKAIRESELFPFFDAPCLSYELGMQKPDFDIFKHCVEWLHVEPGECLYVGDGGSMELETARELGMSPLQAVWYLKEGTGQPVSRKEGFIQLESPMEVLDYVGNRENLCPCCGQYQFESVKRGSYDICPICFWEDAPYSFEEPNAICSCNGVSLNQARRNFAEFGACRRDMVAYVRTTEEL